MTADLQDLVDAALEARGRAYAPYSHFKVGAAVLGEDGRIYPGCNVENASYGSTICAERAAVCRAVAAGCRRLHAVAIVADGRQVPYPCGACRQVLAEFAGEDLVVCVQRVDDVNGAEILTLGALLPKAFRLREEI